MSGMQGRFRSEKVPQIEREVGDPAPPEVEIDGRTYRLVETIGSLQAGDFVALYDEIPPPTSARTLTLGLKGLRRPDLEDHEVALAWGGPAS
jgi:hypothetical protein